MPDGLDGEFALYMFSRRNAFAVRRGVNARVVVVGASETGLAALERLLMDPACSFNYLTLLAPGGITVGGVACQYTASEWFVRLCDCTLLRPARRRVCTCACVW